MRNLFLSAIAAALLLTGGSAVWADDDIVRLGGPSAQADIQGGTDIELVRGYYGGGYGRGYGGGGDVRGYYGGGYGRGYYGGGYGRGYYGGGYGRGFYGGYGGYGYRNAFYRPYFYGSFYRPYYASYYGSPYYYTPYYSSYYADDYYYPTSGITAAVITMQSSNNYQSAAPERILPFSPDGTYPYNGGPDSAIPMPMPTAPTDKMPRGTVPLEGKLVTLPQQSSGGISPVTSPDIQRLHFVNTPSAAPVRVSYPAYGEK